MLGVMTITLLNGHIYLKLEYIGHSTHTLPLLFGKNLEKAALKQKIME
jgi:hypothetical protein